MIERPTKQVSLRAFRERIATFTEPVEVSRRDGVGNIQVLGFWTPYQQPVVATHPSTMSAAALDAGADSEEIRPPVLDIPIDDEPAPKVIRTPEEAAAVVATIPAAQPYPKDVQAGRRKRR